MNITVARAAAFVLAAALARPAAAQPDLYATWLLDASRTDGPTVEVWRASPRSRSFTWRLVDGDGSVLAQRRQPPIPRGYTLNFGECRIAGKLRHDVLAIVRHRKGRDWSTDVRAVWVASPRHKAFVPRPVRGVACRDEGFGL